MAKQTSLINGVQISLIFCWIVIDLSTVVFYVKLAFDQLACCFGNYIILEIALHWDLHCFVNCTAIGIALYCELSCIGNCIVLGSTMYWEFHCIECSLEYSGNFFGGFMETLSCCCFCLAKWVTDTQTEIVTPRPSPTRGGAG